MTCLWLSLFDPAAPGISASPAEDNLRYFNVMILGPSQSPYEGAGILQLFSGAFLLGAQLHLAFRSL